MANGYRRPVCRSTVHSPTSRRIVEIQLTGDDHDGHCNIVNNRTNRSRRYARTNCARRRTFGPIYTTTHEDSGGGGARDCRCRCWCRRRRYPSWNGSKFASRLSLLSVPNQSMIDAEVAERMLLGMGVNFTVLRCCRLLLSIYSTVHNTISPVLAKCFYIWRQMKMICGPKITFVKYFCWSDNSVGLIYYIHTYKRNLYFPKICLAH